MKHAPYLCVTLALLAACQSKPLLWDKPGASEASRKDDLDACHLQAMTSPQVRPTPSSAYGATTALSVDESRAWQERLVRDECMAGKGYGAKR
jgi:hypothetical protein